MHKYTRATALENKTNHFCFVLPLKHGVQNLLPIFFSHHHSVVVATQEPSGAWQMLQPGLLQLWKDTWAGRAVLRWKSRV